MEFKSLCGKYRFAFTRLQKLRKGKTQVHYERDARRRSG